MTAKEDKCRRQFDRQMAFPSDRIAFYRPAFWNDMYNMSRYQEGTLSLDELCKIVCENNFLGTYFKTGKIPEGIMLNELRICGYECRERNPQ